MPQNLTPEQLAAILAGYPTMGAADQARQGLFAGWGDGAFHLPEYAESARYETTGVGDGSSTHLVDPYRGIYRELNGGAADAWDPDTGQYLGQSTGTSDGRMAMQAALMLAGGAYGAYSAGGGAAAGAASGAGTAGGTVSLTAADIAASNAAATAGLGGQVAATAPGYLGAAGTAAGGVGAAGAAAGGGGAGGAGAYTTAAADSQAASAGLGLGANAGSVPAGVNLTNAGGTMATGAGAGGSFMGMDYSTWAKLAGAAMGAASSGDQTQSTTQNREPWGPAQDWIRQNIGIGQGLQQHYQQQPFNAQQQQAMNQKAGLLGALQTQAMPGLLSGLNQMGQGYQRKGGPAPRQNAMTYDPQALLAAMQNYRG